MSAQDKSSAGESGARTLHQRILADIEGRILSGKWPPGFQLPFETELAAQYGCSRMTVNKVLTQLARARLIERRRRVGSFVRRPTAQSAALELHDIETEVKSLGLAYSFTLLFHAVRPSGPEDRRMLDLPEGTPLIELLALHRAGGNPFCVEQRRINGAVVPAALHTDFSLHAPGSWLIAQVPWSTAENRIQAIAANAEIARLLEQPGNAPCLQIERRTWNHAGPVTHVKLTYPGDSHVLIARFTPEQP